MAAEYYVVVRDTTGAKVAVITDFWGLGYSKRVNDIGLGVVQMQDDDDLVSTLGIDYQFEFMRQDTNAGLNWHADFEGFLRRIDRSYIDGRPTYIATLTEQQSLFARRIIAYPAGTNRRNDWQNVAGETVMKEIVTYNMTSAGTVGDGRVRAAALSGYTITVATDQSRGNPIYLGAAWNEVLAALQKVASIAGGDFRLGKAGPAAWEFEFYPGQLGTDRTGTVVFALAYGNIGDPSYTLDRTHEATVAIVGGQGEGDERATTVVTGPDYSAANDIEAFVDARDTSSSGLADRGASVLNERQAIESLDFNVIQTQSSHYGVHYFLGDLVTVRYRSLSLTKKIQAVHITTDPDQGESVEIELVTP